MEETIPQIVGAYAFGIFTGIGLSILIFDNYFKQEQAIQKCISTFGEDTNPDLARFVCQDDIYNNNWLFRSPEQAYTKITTELTADLKEKADCYSNLEDSIDKNPIVNIRINSTVYNISHIRPHSNIHQEIKDFCEEEREYITSPLRGDYYLPFLQSYYPESVQIESKE